MYVNRFLKLFNKSGCIERNGLGSLKSSPATIKDISDLFLKDKVLSDKPVTVQITFTKKKRGSENEAAVTLSKENVTEMLRSDGEFDKFYNNEYFLSSTVIVEGIDLENSNQPAIYMSGNIPVTFNKSKNGKKKSKELIIRGKLYSSSKSGNKLIELPTASSPSSTRLKKPEENKLLDIYPMEKLILPINEFRPVTGFFTLSQASFETVHWLTARCILLKDPILQEKLEKKREYSSNFNEIELHGNKKPISVESINECAPLSGTSAQLIKEENKNVDFVKEKLSTDMKIDNSYSTLNKTLENVKHNQHTNLINFQNSNLNVTSANLLNSKESFIKIVNKHNKEQFGDLSLKKRIKSCSDIDSVTGGNSSEISSILINNSKMGDNDKINVANKVNTRQNQFYKKPEISNSSFSEKKSIIEEFCKKKRDDLKFYYENKNLKNETKENCSNIYSEKVSHLNSKQDLSQDILSNLTGTQKINSNNKNNKHINEIDFVKQKIGEGDIMKNQMEKKADLKKPDLEFIYRNEREFLNEEPENEEIPVTSITITSSRTHLITYDDGTGIEEKLGRQTIRVETPNGVTYKCKTPLSNITSTKPISGLYKNNKDTDYNNNKSFKNKYYKNNNIYTLNRDDICDNYNVNCFELKLNEGTKQFGNVDNVFTKQNLFQINRPKRREEEISSNNAGNANEIKNHSGQQIHPGVGNNNNAILNELMLDTNTYNPLTWLYKNYSKTKKIIKQFQYQ